MVTHLINHCQQHLIAISCYIWYVNACILLSVNKDTIDISPDLPDAFDNISTYIHFELCRSIDSMISTIHTSTVSITQCICHSLHIVSSVNCLGLCYCK